MNSFKYSFKCQKDTILTSKNMGSRGSSRDGSGAGDETLIPHW